jgi:tetratricopeptide (TPR) repeat protein
MENLFEARRLAELNQAKFFLARLPNTFAWLYRELGDAETSHLLNLENVEMAREFDMPEGKAHAHVNLGIDYMDLGELERARENLEMAESIFAEDIWTRWRYNIRLKAEYARYWLERGDLSTARTYAEAAVKAAQEHGDRKYRAWSWKILGEIALLEDDVNTARACYDEAIGILQSSPCPTIGWKILSSRADLAAKLGDTAAADDFRGRARAVIRSLADSLTDSALRTRFLKSQSVREL